VNAVDSQRIGQVLHASLAEIIELKFDLAPNMAKDCLGYIDAARRGDTFQPRCNIDAVTIEIAALYHHVAQVDPDAQNDPSILGDRCVGGGHFFPAARRRRPQR